MKKGFILLLIIVGFLYLASAEKLNKIKKNRFKADDIIESVHSDTPEVPQIKIRLANADEEDADADATISMDLGNEEDDDDDDDDDDDLIIRKKKLSKSKTEDIHSFL